MKTSLHFDTLCYANKLKAVAIETENQWRKRHVERSF